MPPVHEFRSARSVGVLAVLFTCSELVGSPAAHAVTQFTASIVANANYTDNVELANDEGQKVDSFIFELNPSFNLDIESSHLRSRLHYELQSLHYVENSDLDHTYHEASLGGELIILPEWFSIFAQGAYGQRVVSPERTLNYDNLFATGDLSDETSATFAPTLRHRFRTVTLEASYTRAIVEYSRADEQGDLDDSERDSYFLSLGRDSDEVRFPWGIQYRTEQVNYDTAAPYEYDRASAYVGIPLGRRMSLLASGGAETDVSESTTTGGLDSSFWRGGLRLEGDPRTQLELWYGRRFFGDTYEVRLARTARRLKLMASYSEEPQTETERRTRIREEATPIIVPETGGRGYRPTAEPYLLKLANVSLTLEGRVTTIALTAFTYDQQYIRVVRGEENRGVAFQLTRRFGLRTEGTLLLQRTETYFAENPLQADDSDVGTITLTRRLSESFQIITRVLHVRRIGPVAGDYDASVFTVGFAKTF